MTVTAIDRTINNEILQAAMKGPMVGFAGCLELDPEGVMVCMVKNKAWLDGVEEPERRGGPHRSATRFFAWESLTLEAIESAIAEVDREVRDALAAA